MTLEYMHRGGPTMYWRPEGTDPDERMLLLSLEIHDMGENLARVTFVSKINGKHNGMHQLHQFTSSPRLFLQVGSSDDPVTYVLTHLNLQARGFYEPEAEMGDDGELSANGTPVNQYIRMTNIFTVAEPGNLSGLLGRASGRLQA